jgi:4-amino-4-deoxy-L-arabinose transferase-like glycosyltransferase
MGREKAWGTAVALGVSLGLGLMTRQGISYTLCGLPVVTVGLHFMHRRMSERAVEGKTRVPLGRAVAQLVVAAVIAGAMWSPYLVANFGASAAEMGGTVAELKRRILYQTQFTDSKESRLDVAARNFRKTFVLSHVDRNGGVSKTPTEGWMFLYLTPGIFAATLLGLIYLAVRRQWLILGFLLAWIFFMLGPVIVMGNTIFSRYVLAGVPPLLIAAGFLLSDVLAWILSRKLPAGVAWLVVILILAGLLILPIREIGGQTRNWRAQTLTVQDHYQYIVGGSSGLAVQSAIRTLEGSAKNGPLVVITDAGWGNPTDAAWVYLSRNPNVSLYYRIPEIDGPVFLTPSYDAPAEPDEGPIITKNIRKPAPPYTYLLRKNKFLYTKPEPVTLKPDVPVFVLASSPVHTHNGPVPAEKVFREANPNLGQPISFYGVDGPAGEDSVSLFPLDLPGR